MASPSVSNPLRPHEGKEYTAFFQAAGLWGSVRYINPVVAAKRFIKPIPHEELRREIDIFCDLFARPAVNAGLKKFVESTEAQPYLP